MTRIGLDRRGKSLPCGFLFDRKSHYLAIQSEKGSNNIRKTVAGKLLYIYSPASCTWLWENNFPVGKKYFSSWGDMVLQLGFPFPAISAWIYGINIRGVSQSGVFENQIVGLLLLKTGISFACAPAHAQPRSRVYNIMRVGQESLLFLTSTVK